MVYSKSTTIRVDDSTLKRLKMLKQKYGIKTMNDLIILLIEKSEADEK